MLGLEILKSYIVVYAIYNLRCKITTTGGIEEPECRDIRYF
jgi:hypothetical protein